MASRRCFILNFRLPLGFYKDFSLKIFSQRTACKQAVESANPISGCPNHPARAQIFQAAYCINQQAA